MGNRQMISTGAAQGERISRLIDDGIAISTARPLDVKKLSVNCYSVLIQIADTTHGSRSDEPLYRNYVLPVMKEIESSYFLPLTIEKLSRQVFITPQYLSPALPSLSQLLRIRISDFIPAEQGKRAADHQSASGDTGYRPSHGFY